MSTGNFGSDSSSSREPAGDLWRRTLARIPTLFGRLIYLSSLRNKATGLYEHPALAQMLGDEQSGDTLRRSHTRVFQDWLCLTLEQQKADVQEYLAEDPNPCARLADWSGSGSWQSYAPPAAQDVEGQLFTSDFQTLLTLLTREYGAASTDPGS